MKTLRQTIHDILTTFIDFGVQDQSRIWELVEAIVLAVERQYSNEGGLFYPTDGGWQEWLLKSNVRPLHVKLDELERIDELLAWRVKWDGDLVELRQDIIQTLGLR